MVVKFQLKRPQAKTSTLFTRFMLNGIPFKFNTGKSINKNNLAKSGLEVNSGEDGYKLINLYLETWTAELKTIIRQKEANKERLVQKSIQECLDKAMNKDGLIQPIGEVIDFISFMELYITKSKTPYANIYKLRQIRQFVIQAFGLISKNNLLAYQNLSEKERAETLMPNDKQLPFYRIDLNFMLEFQDYMKNVTFSVGTGDNKTEKLYKVNYVNKVVKKLKEFLLAAIDKKFVPHFTWNEIKGKDKEVDSVYTDFTEIQAIYDIKLTDLKEIQVRDKYVLNTFLGMRYNDFNNVAPHDYKKKTILGKEYIIYSGRSAKTGTRVEFALHPNAVAILEKYNYEMPKIPLSEFNVILKVVCFKAGLIQLETIREVRGKETIVLNIPKYSLMSSHAGRRSFCTNFYTECVTIAAIMGISGHLTEHEFRKYIRSAIVRLEVVAAQISAIKGLNVLKAA